MTEYLLCLSVCADSIVINKSTLSILNNNRVEFSNPGFRTHSNARSFYNNLQIEIISSDLYFMAPTCLMFFFNDLCSCVVCAQESKEFVETKKVWKF